MNKLKGAGMVGSGNMWVQRRSAEAICQVLHGTIWNRYVETRNSAHFFEFASDSGRSLGWIGRVVHCY